MTDTDEARKLVETLQVENPGASAAEIAQLYIAEARAIGDPLGKHIAGWDELIEPMLREWVMSVVEETKGRRKPPV